MPTGKEKIIAGKKMKKEGRKELRSENKQSRVVKRVERLKEKKNLQEAKKGLSRNSGAEMQSYKTNRINNLDKRIKSNEAKVAKNDYFSSTGDFLKSNPSDGISVGPTSEMKVEKQMSMMGPSMYGSPTKMNNSPMQMKGSWISKHCSK